MAILSVMREASLLSLATIVVSQSNPIKVTGSTWISDNQDSTNDPYIIRDGGYQGKIGPLTVQLYADTLSCDASNYESGSGCNFIAPNTLVANTFAANEVTDFNSPTPSTFCTTAGTNDASNDRLHVTNVLSTGDTTGVVWYVDLTQYNTDGCTELDGCPNAIGVASVDYNNGNPTCSPQAGYWDPSNEPMWGGAAAIGPLADGNLYVMGQLDGGASGSQYNDVWVGNVPHGTALDYSTYEYWDGNSYTSTRLQNPNNNGYAPASVLTGISSFGSWFYSPYYDQYIVLAVNTSNGQDVLAYAGAKPEGPYSDPIVVYTNSSFGGSFVPVYSPQALPSFDTTGKTLTFVLSLFGRNSVSGVIKINFA